MKIVVFEDSSYKNLLPLVYFRPVWELRFGAYQLADRLREAFPDLEISFSARDYLASWYLATEKLADKDKAGDWLLINGCLAAPEPGELLKMAPNELLVRNGRVVALRIKSAPLSNFIENGVLQTDRVLRAFRSRETRQQLINYPWDLIDGNGDRIRKDFAAAGLAGKIEGQVDTGAYLLNRERIYIGAGARIMPGVVLNAENGAIWIEKNSTVMPGAVIEGPGYIGENSRIKVGAKIYQNSSIGPVCKVGGEVEGSIIQGYSNKQHDGFLGHSYLGAWVNIGADTNNSDLKNTYGEITVHLNGSPVHTGKRFVGLIMGDHSKTAINTMFNTGTVVGVNCNVYGAGFPPKFIPSFSMGGSGGFREYNFDKALEVARVVMGRRGIEFSDEHVALFREVRKLAEQVENRARTRS